MKNIKSSILITLAFCVFFSVFYIFPEWVFAKIAGPGHGNAEVMYLDGDTVGAANVGQAFVSDTFFWSRPSAVDYAANGSGGSNKGATNPEYLAEVESRIENFLAHHPYLTRKDVPAEMVTASGSGLDPHITPYCADIQVKRVAKNRGLSESEVQAIVDEFKEEPLLGLFGTSRVNVLKLNVALQEYVNAKKK